MRRVKNLITSYVGLITLADVLGVLGYWLYKGTVRRTVAVGLILLILMIVGKRVEILGIGWESAVTGTGGILVISCIGGLMLMAISGSFSRSVLALAEAKGSNLLEDMKRSRMFEHSRRLWERVLRYEQDAFTNEEMGQERQLAQAIGEDVKQLCLPNISGINGDAWRLDLAKRTATLGRTEEGWKVLFDYATHAPLPRSVLRYGLRYDLSLIVDWYDGAPFHHTDNKLFEQYHGAENLVSARRQAKMGYWHKANHKRQRFLQSLYFKMITRAIQLRVARACSKLDKLHPPFHFAPDLFLWPSEQTYRVVRERMGEDVVNELIDYRKRIFHRVLHPEMDYARKLMHKAIYPNFVAATHLRRCYDPQYVIGELDETWESDLKHYDRALAEEAMELEQPPHRFVEAARTRQQEMAEFLQNNPTLASADDPLAKRAASVAMHVNRQANGKSPETIITPAIENKFRYARRLFAVRIHHELTRIELEDYELYLDRIIH